jgi:hypothetical protein
MFNQKKFFLEQNEKRGYFMPVFSGEIPSFYPGNKTYHIEGYRVLARWTMER